MVDIKRLYSERAGKMRKSEIRELLKVTQDPEIISFAGGLPNPTSFPIDDLASVTHSVLKKHGKTALQYGTTQGFDDLRSEELSILPGTEELVALLELKKHIDEADFDIVIVDCAPTGSTIRLLSLPDIGRWYMTRLFNIERKLITTILLSRSNPLD